MQVRWEGLCAQLLFLMIEWRLESYKAVSLLKSDGEISREQQELMQSSVKE